MGDGKQPRKRNDYTEQLRVDGKQFRTGEIDGIIYHRCQYAAESIYNQLFVLHQQMFQKLFHHDHPISLTAWRAASTTLSMS